MANSFGFLNLLGLLALGGAWLLTVRLVFARRSSQGDDLMQRGMSIAGWLLVLLGVLGLLGLFIGPVALLAFPVFLLVVGMAVGRYRHSERRSLVWSLAIAAERGIPLEQAAYAFADERYDETGLRAARLAKELEAGVGLPDALRRSRNFLPFDARLACGIGWQAGCLGPALRGVVASYEAFDDYFRHAIEKALYLCLLLSALCWTFTFLLVSVVPGLGAVYTEFNMELPWATEAVLDVADAFGFRRWWLLLAPAYFVVFVVVLAAIGYFVGWLRWEPWFLRRLWRRLHTAWILRFLSFTVAQGRPMEHGVRLLSANYPATYIAQRLYAATGLIASGRHWCDALRAKRLIGDADAGVLRAAERAGNLAWALEEMSDSNLRRLALRYRAVLTFVFPTLILACGAVIFAVVMSLFLPMIEILKTIV